LWVFSFLTAIAKAGWHVLAVNHSPEAKRCGVPHDMPLRGDDSAGRTHHLYAMPAAVADAIFFMGVPILIEYKNVTRPNE
jgi:hypothetical protein